MSIQFLIAAVTLLYCGREVATRAGKNKILVANITGITPALFTFNGMYVLCPPITFLPLTRFANCIGILL